MFKSFSRTLPQVSIYHNSASPVSTRALKLLQSAVSSSYPPDQPDAGPLKFNLEVIEGRPPTPDQLRTILSYQKSPDTSFRAFLSAHPSAPEGEQGAESVASAVSSNPNVFKWPVVVDWFGGRSSIGELDGVKEILEGLRKERDEGS